MTDQTPETEVVQPTEAAPESPAKKPKKSKNDTAALTARVQTLEQELAANKEQYQRILAEYANYKRRTEQEKEQIGAFTTAALLTRLLPILDNMERAVAAPAGDDYKTGVDMIMRQLHEELARIGLAEIAEEGVPFDPEIHNAVMREDAEDVEVDTVAQVFQKGYRYGDRVLRPAMVKVIN